MKRKIIICMMLLFVLSVSAIASDITVNENVKLGGIVVEAQDYKLYYTGYDTNNLYFTVITDDVQYQMIVMHAMKISMFDLDIGTTIKVKNIGKYLDLEIERIE